MLDVDDLKVIFISYRWQTLDPEMIRLVGLDPLMEKIVVVKSTIHYRADFEPIAREVIARRSGRDDLRTDPTGRPPSRSSPAARRAQHVVHRLQRG